MLFTFQTTCTKWVITAIRYPSSESSNLLAWPFLGNSGPSIACDLGRKQRLLNSHYDGLSPVGKDSMTVLWKASGILGTHLPFRNGLLNVETERERLSRSKKLANVCVWPMLVPETMFLS